MTRLKIYRIDSDDSFQGLVRSPDESQDDGSCALEDRGLFDVSSYCGRGLAFEAMRRNQAKPKAAFNIWGLHFPVEIAKALGLRSGPDIQLLPVSVEHNPWVLVRLRYQMAGWEEGASLRGFEIMPGVCSSYHRWINTTDQKLVELELFKAADGDSSPTYVTQSFVDRIKVNGITGLRFKHIGYVISDPSEAVFPPAPPLSKPSPRKGPKARILALPPDLGAELAADGEKLRAELAVLLDASAAEVLPRLMAYLEAGKASFVRTPVQVQVSLCQGLGRVYGDLFVQAFGWQHRLLEIKRGYRYDAIVSPDQRYAVPLSLYIRQQLEAPPSQTPTLKLQYNMVAAGRLPPPPHPDAPLVMA